MEPGVCSAVLFFADRAEVKLKLFFFLQESNFGSFVILIVSKGVLAVSVEMADLVRDWKCKNHL